MLEVSVEAVDFKRAWIVLRGVKGKTDDPYLVVSLKAKNLSADRFLDWRGLGGFRQVPHAAILKDEKGNVYRHVAPPPLSTVVDRATDTRIRPEDEVDDILLFEPPIPSAKELTLVLPAPNDERPISFLIPTRTILGFKPSP